MIPFAPYMRRLGGVAETRELLRRGIEPHALTSAVRRGDLIRVRRGWYSLPETDLALQQAIRVGGRLACVSAAAHYGWATPEHHGLHVCVAENSSRLRAPSGSGNAVVVHWTSPLAPADRPRLVTDRFETVAQIVRCPPPEFAIAALDSFLHDDPVGSRDLEAWLSSLPA